MVSSKGFLRKPLFYIFFVFFILWIVLFEFIIPENSFLPKPGIVILTIPALFEDYHLIADFFTTISAVYLPALLAYLLIFLFRKVVLRKSGGVQIFTGFISQLSGFFPPVLLGIVFIFWFPHSFITEYIFSFIISAIWWFSEIRSKGIAPNDNYLVSFKSFGADEAFINKHIIWNEVKPAVFGNLVKLHLHLWAVILVFEFISEGYGLGSLLSRTLIYHDLSAFFLVLVIISGLILTGFYFIKYIENRYIFWSAE